MSTTHIVEDSCCATGNTGSDPGGHQVHNGGGGAVCLAGNLNQLVPGSTKHNCVEIFDISRAGHDNFGRWGSSTDGIPVLRLVNLPNQFLELGTEDIWFVIGLGSRASSQYTMVSTHTRSLEN